MLDLIVELVDQRAKMPKYCDPDDAGLDVYACPTDRSGNPVNEACVYPGETILVSLGFRVGLPEGWYLSVVPRSGISLRTQLRVSNAPGTIDTNYKGIVKVIVTNLSNRNAEHMIYANKEQDNNQGTYVICAGDRIAQIVPMRRYKVHIVPGVAKDIGADRGGGFGHSGI